MTSLIAYDRACAAIVEATRVDEVLAISNEIEHVRLYAKQIKDQRLLAEATALQMQAERKLGLILAAAKERGQIREGRHRKQNGTDSEPFTLAEIGVDKKLSARAQQRAAMPADDFAEYIEAAQTRIVSGKIKGDRAIMGSRQEAIDSLDYFPTPPWATRALMQTVIPQFQPRGAWLGSSVWEPACGEGHIAEVLREYTDDIIATDVYDYGYGQVYDFLKQKLLAADDRPDWIITNPPFGDKTEAFVLRSLEYAQIGIAMFVRLQWLETIGRYEHIFRDHPPTLIAFFAERVNLCKGRWQPDGGTATAYIWLVWIKGQAPRAPMWIPPGQQEAWTRPTDASQFTASPVRRRERSVPEIFPQSPQHSFWYEGEDEQQLSTG